VPALSAALGVLAAVHAVILPLIARLWAIGHRERVQRLLELGVTVAAVAGVALSAGTVVAGHRVAGARSAPAEGPAVVVAHGPRQLSREVARRWRQAEQRRALERVLADLRPVPSWDEACQPLPERVAGLVARP
jgi:hypothetical protein